MSTLNESLISAAANGDAKSVATLIESGADVNAADDAGWTVLALVIGKIMVLDEVIADHSQEERALRGLDTLEAELAKIGGRDSPATAKKLADSIAALTETRDRLLRQTATISDQHSLRSAYVEVMRRLLQSGARADCANEWIKDYFLKMCAKGPLDMVQLFLVSGADADAYDWMPALMHATDQPDIFKVLLDHGANIHVVSDLEVTVLDVLLSGQCLDLAQLVVEYGGNVNERNYYLTRAVEEGHKDVVQFLMRHGADPNRPNDRGDTPQMLARLKGREDIAMLLQPHDDSSSGQEVQSCTARRSAASVAKPRQEIRTCVTKHAVPGKARSNVRCISLFVLLPYVIWALWIGLPQFGIAVVSVLGSLILVLLGIAWAMDQNKATE